jgi:hypothetical protein
MYEGSKNIDAEAGHQMKNYDVMKATSKRQRPIRPTDEDKMISIHRNDMLHSSLAAKTSFLMKLAADPSVAVLEADQVARLVVGDSRGIDVIPGGAVPWPLVAYRHSDIHEELRRSGVGMRPQGNPPGINVVLLGADDHAAFKGRHVVELVCHDPDAFALLRNTVPFALVSSGHWHVQDAQGPFTGRGWQKAMAKAALTFL